ncbi:uncharacterized protein LOC116451097 [Corvus moneduloides]|uniref:uncharacterized protein LOC116451097 n=1 Tax=Corvus moneduloides TaxID=1196302 RepID=UPI0013635FA9|nr:uncharacterized protein LOC116451097 [Corvus moneduloides]
MLQRGSKGSGPALPHPIAPHSIPSRPLPGLPAAQSPHSPRPAPALPAEITTVPATRGPAGGLLRFRGSRNRPRGRRTYGRTAKATLGTPAPTPGHSLPGRLQLEAARPPARIFQAGTEADKSHIFQVQFHSTSNKSELPSLCCRLNVLAPTWISGASGCALLLSVTLPCLLLYALPAGDLTKPWDCLINLFLALDKLALCATGRSSVGNPNACTFSCLLLSPGQAPLTDIQASVVLLRMLHKILYLFQKDEHLGQTNNFRKVGNKF